MSRIQEKFSYLRQQHRKALIPFITTGDPNLETTRLMMHELVRAGADIIELGMPFSDPMADGPSIQRSSERALKQGVSVKDAFNVVREFRKTDAGTPIVLMGYANPIEAMGYENFAQQAQTAGVDGLIVVDYPPEEAGALFTELERHGIDLIFLLAPTTAEARIRQIAKLAKGYVYYVSRKGVTGAANLDLAEINTKISVISSHIQLPIAVGFGIRDGKTAKAIASIADGVIIGSRLVEEIETAAHENLLEKVSVLLKSMRVAMDS